MATLEAKQELEKALAEGRPAPDESPRKLHLEAIREFPEVFQPRGPAGAASRAHVRQLAKTPQGGHALDPVMVFWIGKGWAVIDGHHRLHAYREAGWREPVPVAVFRGTLDEAMGYAGKLNSGEKLPMSNAEKKAHAWRLTTCTNLSKERVRLSSGMSDGFLSNMRRIHRKLTKEMGLAAEEVAGMSWHAAQKRAAGEEARTEDIDWDERTEQEAKEMANRILKAIGKRGQQRHEVLARALEIYDSRLPDSLRELWESNPDF